MQALYTVIDCFGTRLSISGIPRMFCDSFLVPIWFIVENVWVPCTRVSPRCDKCCT